MAILVRVTAVLIHYMGGAEGARTHTTAATELWIYIQLKYRAILVLYLS